MSLEFQHKNKTDNLYSIYKSTLIYSKGDGLLIYLKWGPISAIFSVLALTWFIRYMIIEIFSS